MDAVVRNQYFVCPFNDRAKFRLSRDIIVIINVSIFLACRLIFTL